MIEQYLLVYKNSSSASQFRAAPDDLAVQAAFVRSQPAAGLLDVVQAPIMLLNTDRQIVYSNPALLEMLGATSVEDIAGLRPGEALECVRAQEADYGCGTGPHCSSCGALLTILTAQAGCAARNLCHLTARGVNGQERSAVLRVWGSPIQIGGDRYTAIGVQDASDAVHRSALERTLYDLVAPAGAEIERLADCVAPQSAASAVAAAGRRIERLVRRHALLAAAEAGALTPALRAENPAELMRRAVDVISAETGCDLRVDDADAAPVATDAALAAVVLDEMLSNAIEAGAAGSVSAGCSPTENGAALWVRNSEPVPFEVRPHLFQPGVSTKGPGRGLGTYLMKLIAESYLGGSVEWNTEEAETAFVVVLPREGRG